MITEKTVFILGAGASCPYGFPSGVQLRENICLNFNHKYTNFLYRNFSNVIGRHAQQETIEKFTQTFFRSSISIDLFLSRLLSEHPELVDMGKYIIAFEILDAEWNSQFREQSQIKDQNWYSHLFGRMTDTIRDKAMINNFSKNNVSFITFNYDRSLEQFFFQSLHSSFTYAGVSEQEIKKQLEQLNIVHVYGSLAPLDWQDDKNGIKYRTPITEPILQKTSRNLRIIDEIKFSPELSKAHEWIKEAGKIFFLGFRYASENMEILGLPEIISVDTKIYGTGFGLETNEINKIHKKITSSIAAKYPEKNRLLMIPVIETHLKIENIDCLKLLKNYL